MIKVLVWNCRGLANSPTTRVLQHMVATHSPDVILLSSPFLSPSPSTFVVALVLTSSFLTQSSPFLVLFGAFQNLQPNFATTLIDFTPQHLTVSLSQLLKWPDLPLNWHFGSTSHITRRVLWQHLLQVASTHLHW